MCTISVKINENMIKDKRPELGTAVALRKWAQMIIDRSVAELMSEDEETMSIEDARAMTLAAVREEYAKV